MLIGTKLVVPPVHEGLIQRKHLANRVSDVKNRRLVVVSGVAGSGKTSLVSQWASTQPANVGWLSLDHGDNDPDLFLRYTLAAFCSIHPNIKDGLQPLVQSEDSLLGENIIPILITVLEETGNPIYLVIDDYHFIINPLIHDIVAQFINHVGRNVHFILISRLAIPFKVNHLKVRDQMEEITQLDLQFSKDESAAFLLANMPGVLSDIEAQSLIQQVEGWVGGLQLAGLSLKNRQWRPEIGRILENLNEEAADYLINEVVNIMPEDVQGFVRATALLDRFNDEVVSHIAAIRNPARIRDYVFRNNSFMVALDSLKSWYRYHDLFSGAVRENMKTHFPAQTKFVYQRAAGWFAEQGYLEEAFGYAFASGDTNYAAELMEDYFLNMHEYHEYSSGLRWISKLPEAVIRTRALLRLHECGQKIERLRFKEQDALIDYLEKNPEVMVRGYQEDKRDLCDVMFRFNQSVLKHFYHDPLNANVRELNRTFDLIAGRHLLFAGFIKMMIVFHKILRAEIDSARGYLDHAYSFVFESSSQWARVLWFRLSATIERLNGNLNRSDLVLQQANDHLSKKSTSGGPLDPLLYIPQAWSCYHAGNLAPAVEYAVKAVQFGDTRGFVRDTIEGNLILSLSCLAGGDKEKAHSYMDQMMDRSKLIDSPDSSISPGAWKTRLLYMLGEEIGGKEGPVQMADLDLEPFSMAGYLTALTAIERTALLSTEPYLFECLLCLRERCVESGFTQGTIEIDLVHCVALVRAGKGQAAEKLLGGVIPRVAEENYFQLCLNYSFELRPLFINTAKKLRDVTEKQFVTRILDSTLKMASHCDAGRISSMQGTPLLTPRELDILRLIAEGKQNKEIAIASFVTSETVKSHIKNIYRKLKVGSRVQAVLKAELLELI